eukprot:gene10335-10401_t
MKTAHALAFIRIIARLFAIDAALVVAGAAPAAASAPHYARPHQIGTVHLSSGFGLRVDPVRGHQAMHGGIDLAAAAGTPVLAAAAGQVQFSGWRGGYGNCVELRHDDGTRTRYGHLSALLVRMGDRVARGDFIARVGSTGRSTGNHLHFEYWRFDHARGARPVDPLPYLADRAEPAYPATAAIAADPAPFRSAFARGRFDSDPARLPGGTGIAP